MMRRKFINELFFIISACFICSSAYSVDKNFDIGQINLGKGKWLIDPDHVLSSPEANRLNSYLVKINEKTKIEIIVFLFAGNPGSVESISLEAIEKWKIGLGHKKGFIIAILTDYQGFYVYENPASPPAIPGKIHGYYKENKVESYIQKRDYIKAVKGYVDNVIKVIMDSGYKETLLKQIEEEPENKKTPSKINLNLTRDAIIFFLVFFLTTIFLYFLGFHKFFNAFLTIQKAGKKRYRNYHDIFEIQKNGIAGIRLIRFLWLFIAGWVSFTFFSVALAMINLITSATIGYFQILPVGIIIVISGLIVNTNSMAKKIVNNWRQDSRSCPQCSAPLRKLETVAEENILKESQIIEEKIGALDYDVWVCSKCDYKTIEKYLGKDYQIYDTCEKCSAVAKMTTDSKILIEPTHEREGLRKIYYQCQSCGDTSYRETSIGRLDDNLNEKDE